MKSAKRFTAICQVFQGISDYSTGQHPSEAKIREKLVSKVSELVLGPRPKYNFEFLN